MQKIIIITGIKNSGKTSLCKEVATYCRTCHVDINGFLSPGVITSGEKSAVMVEDVILQKRTMLARKISTHHHADFVFGQWCFYNAGFSFGKEILNRIEACDVLMIDEIGPLEFEHQTGWHNCFERLHTIRYQLAIITMRKIYVERITSQFPDTSLINLDEVDQFYAFQQIKVLINQNKA